MAPPGIRTATAADEDRILAVITLAFAADPFARWVTPDPLRHVSGMPAAARAFAGRAFAAGTAYLSEDGAGAALWLPPGVEPDHETLLALVSGNAAPERLPGILAVFERLVAVHPGGPHWYLPLIGVDPACQGRGTGDALMAHALARIDAEGLPAYLESSNPRNASLYLRHGFRPGDPVRQHGAPPVVPMLRQPRQ
jgi:ribosomal protein S18 acetylase RimI-like enzyme